MTRLATPYRLHPFFSVAVLLSLVTFPAVAFSQEASAIRVQRVSAAPVLDDFIAGRIPADLAKVTGFRQREPKDGEPVSRETTAYVGYDDENFYAVFLCKEDPAKVRARMGKRESIMGDDVVGIMLDTFHDHRRAYEFLVNPLGIQLDGITSAGQDDDFSFDTLWHSEGKLTQDGYAVKIAIPFKSLRFSQAEVQDWGIALVRILPLRNETSFWPYVTKNVTGFFQQMATVSGLERIAAGRNLQFIPYGDFTSARFLDEERGRYGDTNEARGGLDAKMVIKDAFTLDLALNPDFSQVESDEPQVTINQRFEVSFPEKRPFFIENANYFSTGERLFFSRRIADPQFGARLTGKVGRWAIGALVMDDEAPGKRAGEGSPGRDERAWAAVARISRELGGQNAVGVMLTSRDFGPSSNRVASADARFQLGNNVTVQGQAITSETTTLNGQKRSGQAYIASARYDSRTLSIDTTYTDRSPGFRTELGFVPRVDMRSWEGDIGYNFFPKKGRLLSWGPSFEVETIWNHRNELEEWQLGPELELELPANTQVHFGASKAYERFEGFDFHKTGGRVFIETEWLKWLSGMASFSTGDEINYYPSANVAPFLARSQEMELGLTVRPVPALRIENTYIHSRLTAPDTRPGLWGEGDSIFRLHLLRTKGNYQFTRELSLRAIVDYNVLLPNGHLVDLEKDKRFTLDLLATYLLNPGTALYVGVTDAYANLRIDPRLSPVLQRTDRASTSTGRQFFVKMSYLLRY